MHPGSPSTTPEPMVDRSVNPRWETGYNKGRTALLSRLPEDVDYAEQVGRHLLPNLEGWLAGFTGDVLANPLDLAYFRGFAEGAERAADATDEAASQQQAALVKDDVEYLRGWLAGWRGITDEPKWKDGLRTWGNGDIAADAEAVRLMEEGWQQGRKAGLDKPDILYDEGVLRAAAGDPWWCGWIAGYHGMEC